LDFNTTDSILAILDLKNDEKFYYQYFPTHSKNEYYYGIAIFSKYRIIDAGTVTMKNSMNNNAIFADIRYKGDTIRIYNIHLASLHMEQSDYEAGNVFHKTLRIPNLIKMLKTYLKNSIVLF
jgi:endonuclease/exonuclease/phosphatase family metal-dependent hydrolase